MYKKIMLLVSFTMFSIIVIAQKSVNINGRISDQQGAPINAATVYVLNTNYKTATYQNGEFIIKKIPVGHYTMEISALNYVTLIKEVEITDSGSLFNFEMTDNYSHHLDEVTVTAQKVDQDPQKLPFSISTLSAKQVQDYKLWDIKDITGIIPNLYSADPGDKRNVTSIRGITTTSYDPAVATYVDGVNQFGLDSYIGQLQDIDRIEILRGPQGTLYGRNAMGGVINIITRQPLNKTSGFAELGMGSFNQQRYNAGLQIPLVNDKLFLGVAGLYTSQNGFYTNKFTQTPFDDQHSFMGNYYLKYFVTSNLSITLNVKHVENRNTGAFPLVIGKLKAFADPFTVNQNNTTHIIDNTLNASLSVNYTGKKVNINSQSAYQSNYRYYAEPIDADLSPLDGITIIDDYGKSFNHVKVGTQEIRFTPVTSKTSKFKWLAGAYAFYQDNPTKQATHFGKDAKKFHAPFPYFSNIATNKLKSYGLASFAQGTVDISPLFHLTLGLRYDYEHANLAVEGEFQMDGKAPVITRPDTSSNTNSKAFTPKASIDYQFTSSNNIYVSYSTGFRSGGISQLSSDPSQPPLYPYKPEFNNNFEIGSKNVFFDRFKLNLSLFYTNITDVQVPTLILPDAITVIRNAGKLYSRGAEMETELKLFKGFEANYSLGYTHAVFTSLDLASNGSSVNLSGKHQVYTPDVTSMLALQYSYALFNDKDFKLSTRAEWRYLGSQYFDLANTIGQNGYHIFNARVAIAIKKWEVSVWGSNLSDRKYIAYAYDFGAVHLGNPRIYGVSLKTTFNR